MMFARKPAVADRGEVYFFHQRGIITRSNPVIRGLQFGESLKKKKERRKKEKRVAGHAYILLGMFAFLNELFPGWRVVPRDKCKENQIYERSIKESPRSSIIAFFTRVDFYRRGEISYPRL